MDAAGPAQGLAAALNHSAFNLANALGGPDWAASAWPPGLAGRRRTRLGAGLAVDGFVILLISAMGQRAPPCIWKEAVVSFSP